MSSPSLPSALGALLAARPLPRGWCIEECLAETTAIDGLAVEVVGLVARAHDGREAIGSAGERGEPPFARAFFELLERIVIVEALGAPLKQQPLFDESRTPISTTAAWNLPECPADAPYRYARSNGVAAATNWAGACTAARAELVERDRILCAWYGFESPDRIALPDDPALIALAPHYEFSAFAFPEPRARAGQSGASGEPLEVIAVFGLPRSASVPLIMGSGAGLTRSVAWDRALRECLQRWAFLWGEAIPEREPEFSPSADYHQELYLWPAMHERLRAWLAGGHTGLFASGASALRQMGRVGYLDLAGSLAPDLCVVRAVSDGLLPLVFGRGHPELSPLPSALSVHPIA